VQVKLNDFLWIFNYLNLQNEKKIVLDFYNLLQKCKIEEIPEVLFDYCSEDLIWRGFHPFNEIKGIKNLSCKPKAILDTARVILRVTKVSPLIGDS